MLGIPLGLVAANAIEWAFHKYVLHGLGRKKESFWSFHFHEHHVAARRNGHLDEAYAKPIWGWNAQSKEALALVGGCALATPLFPVAPFFTARSGTRRSTTTTHTNALTSIPIGRATTCLGTSTTTWALATPIGV